MVDIETSDNNENVIEVSSSVVENVLTTDVLYGPTGNGIQSVVKTSTSGLVDTYTITFTNGTSTTFNVSNGKGIESFELTSSTELTDTYTISYNDGTSTTFTVTNDVEGVSIVADNIETVQDVGSSLDDITAVADDLSIIGLVASDLTNIDRAYECAQLAQDWANKMSGTVDGNEYSAKYYAQQSAQGQLQSNWNESDTTSKSYIQNKPTLATVATSGAYSDLTGQPTIPTVNNATLTIQKNGTDVQTFTANASSNVTCNITVPTNTNELTNGAGFITGINSTDITTALNYTPSDVSLSNINNTAKILISGMGMPSGTYTSLTLGASGSDYTAPANGWVACQKVSGGTDKYLTIYNTTKWYGQTYYAPYSGGIAEVFLPVNKNDVFTINYDMTGTTNYLWFFYANGSESEAS